MKLFRRYRRRLGNELPPLVPTRVVFRRKKVIGCDADSIFNKERTRCVIRLSEEFKGDQDYLCDCLAHEWAHAVAGVKREEHTGKWGLAYAAAWRILDRMLPNPQPRRG